MTEMTEQEIIDFYRSGLPAHLQSGAIHVPTPVRDAINNFGIDTVGISYQPGGDCVENS